MWRFAARHTSGREAQLYGHLLPGSEEEAVGLLDAYLTRAASQAPVALIAP